MDGCATGIGGPEVGGTAGGRMGLAGKGGQILGGGGTVGRGGGGTETGPRGGGGTLGLKKGSLLIIFPATSQLGVLRRSVPTLSRPWLPIDDQHQRIWDVHFGARNT